MFSFFKRPTSEHAPESADPEAQARDDAEAEAAAAAAEAQYADAEAHAHHAEPSELTEAADEPTEASAEHEPHEHAEPAQKSSWFARLMGTPQPQAGVLADAPAEDQHANEGESEAAAEANNSESETWNASEGEAATETETEAESGAEHAAEASGAESEASAKPSWFARLMGAPQPQAGVLADIPAEDADAETEAGEPEEPVFEEAAHDAADAEPHLHADEFTDAEGEIIPPPDPEPGARKSWLDRLRTGLAKTGSNISVAFTGTRIDEDLYEELETALLVSDAGLDATEFLLDALREKVKTERLTEPEQVRVALRDLLTELLEPLEKTMMLGRAEPLVMMIAGVNGAGKTTSIGKLAKHLQHYGQSVLLAAGDTFRAAAREQLVIWGQRNNVTVVQQESGDPAAVIFDAIGAARARGINVMMADTAGRLPTQLHLMEELRKIKRVIGKADETAPHEVLLVIDANTGQNALAQVKAFDDALGLTGLIVTKLDGTAKGGILAAIARQRPVPVYFIGVGERVEDLQPFKAQEFADALLGL